MNLLLLEKISSRLSVKNGFLAFFAISLLTVSTGLAEASKRKRECAEDFQAEKNVNCSPPAVKQPRLEQNALGNEHIYDSDFLSALEKIESDYLAAQSSLEKENNPPAYSAHHVPHSMPMTDSEHIDYLRSEIPKAEEHIIISSWGINARNLKAFGIHDLLVKAKRRGVKIYTYIGGNYNSGMESHAKSISTQCSFMPVHCKIFAVDRDFVALGSFNWLSPFGSGSLDKSQNENGSFVYQGSVSNNIKDAVWEKIKLFKSLHLGNTRAVEKGMSQRSFYRSIPVGSSREVKLLPTGESHINFIDQAIKEAKSRVIISSFSVTEDIDSKLPYDLISQAVERGVRFYFISNGEENCKKIREHFSCFDSKDKETQFTFLNHPKVHAKTWIFDDETIVQTSYNIFSAAPRVRHELSKNWSVNCESGLVVTGCAAKPFIQKYYKNSLFGFVIQNDV